MAVLAGLQHNGSSRNGPSDSEVVKSLEPRKVWKHIRRHAAQGEPPAQSLPCLVALHSMLQQHITVTLRRGIAVLCPQCPQETATHVGPCILAMCRCLPKYLSSGTIENIADWVLVPAALAELKQGMRGAELVQLAPGEMHMQQSSWVLLKGTLRITGHAAFVPAGMPGGRLLFLVIVEDV